MKEKVERRRGRGGKTFWKIAAGVLFLLALSVLLPFFPPALRLGLKAADHFLPVSLEADHIAHLPGRLILSGLQVSTPRGPILELGHLEIDYRPLAFLSGRIVIDRVRLEAPLLLLRRLPDGTLDLPLGLSPSGGKETAGRNDGTTRSTEKRDRLEVREVRVDGGVLVYDDPDLPCPLEWGSLQLDLHRLPEPCTYQVSVREGILRLAGPGGPPLEMETTGCLLLRDGSWKAAGFRIGSGPFRVLVDLDYDPRGDVLKARSRLEAFPAGRLLALLGIPDIEVEEVSGRIGVTGSSPEGLSLEAALRGRAWGEAIRVRLTGVRRQERLRLESIRLEALGMILTGEAGLDLPSGSLDGRLHLEAPRFTAGSLRPSALDGTLLRGLVLDGSLGGTRQAPELRFRLRFDELRLRVPILRAGDLEGSYRGEAGLRLSGTTIVDRVLGKAGTRAKIRAILRGDLLEWELRAAPLLDLQGRLCLGDGISSVSLHAADLQLAPLLGPWVPTLTSLVLSADGHAQGDLRDRQSWRGEASIRRTDLRVAGLALETAAPLRLQLEKGRARVSARLRLNGGTVSIRGGLPVVENEPMELHFDGSLDAAAFLASFPALPSPLGACRGTLRLQGLLSGTVSEPAFRGELRSEAFSLPGLVLANPVAVIRYRPGRLFLRGRWDRGAVEASLDLVGSRRLEVSGSVHDLPLAPLLEAAGLSGWEGRMSLAGRAAGPLMNGPGRWTGRVTFTRLELLAGTVPVRLLEPVALTLGPEGLVVPGLSLGSGDAVVRIEGTLGRRNRLTLRGEVPLDPLEAALPRVRISGARAEVDLAITGSITRPNLDGTLRVKARRIEVKGWAYPVESLEAELDAASSRIELRALSATVGDGEILASGILATSSPFIERMVLELEAVPIRLSPSLGGRIGGKLYFHEDPDGPLLEGDLRILEARYEEDFSLTGLLLRPRRPTPAPGGGIEHPFLERLHLDLHVRSGPELLVRNNIARIRLSVDMEVKGTAAHPVPLGRLSVREGRIRFSKRTFEITEGNLFFRDPAGGPPVIHVESNVTIEGDRRRYVVYLTLDGPLDRIGLELRSLPSLSREDILFVLVTGKTRDEYLASEPVDTERAAEQAALAGISALIGEDLKGWTGLDSFRIEETGEEEFGVATSLGKRLNERMEVRGSFAVGSGQAVSKAQVEYRLTDSILLVGTQRSDGRFSIDVRLHLLGD